VIFKVGAEEFAVDIMLTKEVVLMRDITPVPESESYVEGVMNLRGSLVPVLDLRKRLRATTANAHTDHRIIVANLDGMTAGLIVDGASEVLRVSDDIIEPVPELVAEMGVTYVAGVINFKDRFITLVDLKKALSDEIIGELDAVMNALSSRRRQISPAKAV